MKISLLNKLVLGVSFVAMMGVLTPEHAQAGFKWKSAPKAEVAAPAQQMMEDNIMAPVIVEDPIDWKGEEVTETVPMSVPVESVAAERIVEATPEAVTSEITTPVAAVSEIVEPKEMTPATVNETSVEPVAETPMVNVTEEMTDEAIAEIVEPVMIEPAVVSDEMMPVETVVETAIEADDMMTPMAISETPVVAETAEPAVDAITEIEAPVVAEMAEPAVDAVTEIEAPVVSEEPAEEMIEEELTMDAAPAVDEARIVVIGVENGAMIEGFGNDMSLIIALRQIVPAKYQFAFGQNVDLGQKISWSGDKPWGHVLAEVLYPLDLMAELRGNILTIGQYKKQAPVVPVMETMAAVEEIEMVETVADVVEEVAVETPISDDMPELTGTGDDMRVLAEQVAASEDVQDAVYEEETPIALSAEANPVNMMDIASMSQKEAADPMQMIPEEDVTVVKQWKASSGDMLSAVLTRWTNEANIDLLWTIDYDYVVQSDMMVDGDVKEAAAELFALFENANPQPYARLHQEADGQVLIVKVYEAAE